MQSIPKFSANNLYTLFYQDYEFQLAKKVLDLLKMSKKKSKRKAFSLNPPTQPSTLKSANT